MSHSKNFKGIIYRIYNSGASDKVINVIDDYGRKQVYLAKGVRKPNSRKSHSIDLGNYVNGSIVEGYSVPLLSEVKLIDEFSSWKRDFLKITILQYLCELIDKFALEENKEKKLFENFIAVLNLDTKRPLLAASAFTLKMLNITGNLPNLDECLITSDKLTSEGIYTIQDHVGYVSDKAANQGLLLNQVSDNIYKTQKFILTHKIEEAVRIALSEEETERLFRLHSRWVENTIEGKLKSKEILLTIIKNGE